MFSNAYTICNYFSVFKVSKWEKKPNGKAFENALLFVNAYICLKFYITLIAEPTIWKADIERRKRWRFLYIFY